MENKKLVVLAAGIILIHSLCAQNSAQKLKDDVVKEGVNLFNEKGQFNLSNFDASDCSEIKFIFKVWHNDKFDKEKYDKISEQFGNLGLLCQQTGKKDDDIWNEVFDIIGEPFKDVALMVLDKRGINGNLSIQVERDMIFFEASINYDDSYDKDAWKSIVDTSVNFFRNERWLEQLAPIFNDVMNAGDSSGIHGSLDMELSSNKI